MNSTKNYFYENGFDSHQIMFLEHDCDCFCLKIILHISRFSSTYTSILSWYQDYNILELKILITKNINEPEDCLCSV